MRKKFTLLITVTALLLGGSGQVWGQGNDYGPFGPTGYNNSSVTYNAKGANHQSYAGDGNMILLDGSSSHTSSCSSCCSHNVANAWANGYNPIKVNIPVNGSTWGNPNYYEVFEYRDLYTRARDHWGGDSWVGGSCSGGYNPSSTGWNTYYKNGIIEVLLGADVRLVDNIKYTGNANSASLILPTSDEYSIRFDAAYTGTGGNYQTILPGPVTKTVNITSGWTAFKVGQGLGFWAGITSGQTFTIAGHGSGPRTIPVVGSEGEYGGTRLMLGQATVGQSNITVSTAAGAVYIFNYKTNHDLAYGHGGNQPAVTVAGSNLLIRNDNACKNLTFTPLFAPTISGNGNIYINDYNDDGNAVATTNPFTINQPYDRGVTTFTAGATFNFAGTFTGELVVEGADVNFNNAYTYTATAAASGKQLITARGGCSSNGDIAFTGGAVLVTKTSSNPTLWIAKNDIKTSLTAPVTYTLDGATQTDWRAGRNIDMRSKVDMISLPTATGDINWYAMNNIMTNWSCNPTDEGYVKYDMQAGSTANVLWNAINDIHTKGRVDFAYAGGATGTLSVVADEGNIQAERQLTIDVNEDSNDILISAESPSGITRSPLLGNIYTYDSLRITRHNGGQGTTEVLSQNDIRTAMVDIENTAVSDNDYLIESHMGDIELGYHLINPSAGCTDPVASAIDYNLNYFKYTAPGISTGTLNVYAGFDDTDATKIPWGGGNIRFTRIKETLGNGSNHPTEFKIPFSNWYYCGDATYGAQPYYENAGIIGGVNRCQVVDPTYPCSILGIDYQGFNGELLFDAGTRGNIIINNGGYLTFQGGNGNAKFLTRWGDIDMRYPFDVDSMKGSLLFLASSQLPNKTQTDLCSCDEIRNNVYLQDFKYNPIQNGGSVFIGADNNIKVQYGGLQSGSWMNNKYDPFFNQTEYPCNTGFIHCDADTAKNQARDLILNFDTLNAGGMAMVASDLIDVYKNMVYTGGKGTGLSSVPGYGSLHGETVAGYGLYIKTQADKNNWNMSDHDINNVPNPEVGAACSRDSCKVDFLHNIARVTFHADARIYAEDQHVFISSPVLDTYGNADYNTHQRSGSKTSILVQADSLIFHDSLIIDGKHTRFTTWSDLKYDMPIIRLGHQRFTPATAEPGCVPCYVHPKDTRNSGGTPFLDTVFVTFRNDANSIGRLQTLVAEHAVISFLTDSFDHAKGNPTLNAKFYTDIFKIRNHVELYKTADHTHDGHFELISEEQMESKDYAGIYSRHLHMEPIAPTCSDFKFSQLWLQEPNLDVITSSTFGGFGWIHANVHVENEANLFPGFASLGTNGNCYEQRAGVLKMQDLRMDKGANVKVTVGDYDAHKSFAEMYECPWTLESIELGRYADCLIVDSLSIQGTLDIDIAIRSGLFLAEGESRCFPIIQYQSVEEGVLNNIHLKKDKLTSDDHKSIEGTYYLTIDADTTCNVVYLCIATVPGPKIMRDVYIPPVSGVTTDPVNGTYRVRSGNNFEFKAKYTTDCPLKVMTGRVIDGDKEEIFGTKNANGEYEYVIQQVRTNITLTIGPDCASENPNANDNVDGEIVWSHNNTIYIKVDREDIASIYSVAGQLIKRVDLPEGTYSTDLERGVYIVTLKDGSVHKVILK